MRWRHPHAGLFHLPHMNVHRVWVILIAAPVLVLVHAFGALTFSEVGHGALASDQRISFAMAGLLVVVVLAKHLAGFGALGGGVFSLRERVTHRRRAARKSVQQPDSEHQ